MANQLFNVKRSTDGKFAEVRRIADGQLQLYWTANVREATGLTQGKAQALATLMGLGAAPYSETVTVVEAKP